MNKKIKIIIAIGGTGGHVFPGINLADHLIQSGHEVELTTDKRGYKFISKDNCLKFSLLPSATLAKKNLFPKIYSIIFILYSVLRSILFLIKKRPTLVIGMGGYSSFPICIAAKITRIKFLIYENNLIIGKANKILLPYAKKILVSFKDVDGVPIKYNFKIEEIGNIIKKEIIDYKHKENYKNSHKNISLLILGGSQAAKSFAEILPNIFMDCQKKGIPLKIFQHCLPSQNHKLSSFYKNFKIDFEIFNFSNNLIEYFNKTNLVITRSGSSVLAELTNANIPFISIPLPSSADNHQLKNAIYYKKKDYCFLIEEKEIKDKLFILIKQIYENKNKLDKIILKQSQFSDKNVYKNFDKVLREIINEKN